MECSLCSQPVKARGWCDKHYRAWYRYGDPLVPDQRLRTEPLPPCSTEGCHNISKAKGLCDNCYHKAARTRYEYVCDNCGVSFTGRKRWRGKAFCSRKCKEEAWRGSPEAWAVQRKHNYKRKFGITVEEYEQMRDAQSSRCAICGTDEPNGRVSKHTAEYWLHVDHDHETGKVRALLCSHCNTTLGKMNDDPELLRKAADYLERWSS